MDESTIRIILRAQTGDREAYDALLQSIQTGMYRYLLGLVGDRHLAEDILQEVFVVIYHKLKWLRDPELFRPWSYRIATREAFRQLKRRRGRAALEREETEALDIAAEEPSVTFDPEWAARLPALVGDLSSKSRAVVLLHYGESLPLVEIAQALALSLGTVKSRLHYGLTILRRKVGLEDKENHKGKSHD